MERQLEAILNSLDDAIVCVDDAPRVVLLNKAAARLFQCEPERVVGQPLAQCPALAGMWASLKISDLPLAAGGPRIVRQLEGKRPDGQKFPLEAMLSCAEVNGKRLFTLLFRDISWQQQMEHALQEARKHQAVGALASGIAHDFNNVLTAVISQLDLAIHSPECPENLKPNLNYAQTSARRGAEMVSKLQMFNRQARAKSASADPMEIVEQVVFVLRRSIDPRVEIECETPAPRPWLIRTDYGQLMQALVNLGLNARDAMANGGRLSIQLANATIAPIEARPPKKAGEFVRMTVADTGPGMTPEMLSRLSEPRPATQNVRQGFGLGLSITIGIVAEQGGWVEAESREGQGTRFHVYLPRATETAGLATVRSVLRSEKQTLEGRERILVVDDEEPVRTVIRAVLAYRGYQITEANDGEDAVRKFAEAPVRFDLVLMDLHMPRMDGRDALGKIRQLDPKAKAVMLSGTLHELGDGGSAEIHGVRYLPKPFQNQELLELVRQTLDAK